MPANRFVEYAPEGEPGGQEEGRSSGSRSTTVAPCSGSVGMFRHYVFKAKPETGSEISPDVLGRDRNRFFAIEVVDKFGPRRFADPYRAERTGHGCEGLQYA
jgi:hypothetical protein